MSANVPRNPKGLAVCARRSASAGRPAVELSAETGCAALADPGSGRLAAGGRRSESTSAPARATQSEAGAQRTAGALARSAASVRPRNISLLLLSMRLDSPVAVPHPGRSRRLRPGGMRRVLATLASMLRCVAAETSPAAGVASPHGPAYRCRSVRPEIDKVGELDSVANIDAFSTAMDDRVECAMRPVVERMVQHANGRG
jgi:hypothetical protein